MNNLIIGKTSQISYYFPKEFIRISSRDYTAALSNTWDTVYICFGENRTYLANTKNSDLISLFYKINYELTLKTVEAFAPISKKIIVYSTAELWNDISGPITLNVPFQFKNNHYIMSKYIMTEQLKDKTRYPNVSIIYPFNFNGVYRNGNFLFGKIYSSILKNHRITLGDTYYYRDILHPSIVANESMIHDIGEDFIIGSGRLIFINDLIRDFYSYFGMKYDEMVIEKIDNFASYRNKIFYSGTELITKTNKNIFNIMTDELQEYIKKESYVQQ